MRLIDRMLYALVRYMLMREEKRRHEFTSRTIRRPDPRNGQDIPHGQHD